jgi:hypothetical protein
MQMTMMVILLDGLKLCHFHCCILSPTRNFSTNSSVAASKYIILSSKSYCDAEVSIQHFGAFHNKTRSDASVIHIQVLSLALFCLAEGLLARFFVQTTIFFCHVLIPWPSAVWQCLFRYIPDNVFCNFWQPGNASFYHKLSVIKLSES